MNSIRKSIRLKLFFLFILSAAISGLSTLVILAVFNSIVFGSYNAAIQWLNRNVQLIPVFLLFSGAVFIIVLSALFYIMTQGTMAYLKEISIELHKISEGDLNIRIPIQSTDELGNLAQDINRMSCRLKESFEEERNAENTKKELINNVSHDLRTPLTSVIGYLDLISKKKYADEAELARYSTIAHNKALALNNLVGQLFEYSKLSSNSQKLEFKKINLVEVMEQLLVGFIPQFRDFDMEYRLMVVKKPILVNADVNYIVRLFENIIGNALQFGKEGKYIDIEIDAPNLRTSIIRISDYGEAIPEAEAEKIFERLYRIDQSRTGEQAGAGLGLSIAKSIAKAHGGDIHLELQDNKKTFEIQLPQANL